MVWERYMSGGDTSFHIYVHIYILYMGVSKNRVPQNGW